MISRMTDRPDFLLARILLDNYRGLRRSSRQVPGGTPVAFLKARLNAASESYPTSEATLAIFAAL
jgi:hypothetical protein